MVRDLITSYMKKVLKLFQDGFRQSLYMHLLMGAHGLIISYMYVVNSLYCRHPWDRELVTLIVRVLNSRYLFQSNVCNLFFAGDSATVHIIRVSTIVKCPQGES